MKVTLKFLSQKANLSTTAVSLILNGKDVRVSPEKRQLVLNLAKKYEYMPNSLAVGLVTQKTKIIGLIIPDITNLFFAEIAKQIEQNFNKLGYSIILCNTNDNPNEEKKYVDLLISRGIDALIICVTVESLANDRFFKKLSEQNICCVAFDRWTPNMDCPAVTIDNQGGTYQAVTHLIKKGHKKIGCLAGPITSFSARNRLKGYKKALIDNNIPLDDRLIVSGDYQFKGGYEKGKKLLEKDITAVMVCNDMMAYGFYKAAREQGKKIPEDISVVGFDDLFFSAMLDVPLTSVRQNIDTLSDKICELTLKSLLGESIQKNICLGTSITQRNSTKCIK